MTWKIRTSMRCGLLCVWVGGWVVVVGGVGQAGGWARARPQVLWPFPSSSAAFNEEGDSAAKRKA